jgi:hypothetical protein
MDHFHLNIKIYLISAKTKVAGTIHVRYFGKSAHFKMKHLENGWYHKFQKLTLTATHFTFMYFHHNRKRQQSKTGEAPHSKIFCIVSVLKYPPGFCVIDNFKQISVYA